MQTFCGLTTDGMYEYLAVIYKVADEGTKVTTTVLAERLYVSPAAASSMLKRLEESGFIVRAPRRAVALTEQGRRAALQLIRRQRLLEVFLMKVMGFTWDQVGAESHKLEHAVSAAFEARMDELCGYPTHCPHGDPIPRQNGTLPKETLISIANMEPGQEAQLHRVDSDDASVLRYLGQLNLMPGRSVTLVERAPFNGPVTLQVRDTSSNGLHAANDAAGDETKVLGSELADRLYVLSPA